MIEKRTHRLTKEAISTLKQDNDLCLEVARDLGVTLFTLPSMISRNSKRLTEGVPASKIARKMGKSVEEIIETVVERTVMPAA